MAYPLSEPTGNPRDTGDIASELAEFSRDVALRRHLASVQIHEDQIVGTEGEVYCCDCPAVIPPERLARVPHAVRCVDCQDIYERQIKRTGRGKP
jgi:DnaK suppressor protein